MEKDALETKVFEKSDNEFFKFLEENFSYENVSDLELQNNLNTFKSLSKFRKKVFISRLNSLEESFDQTAILASLAACIIALLGAYKLFLEVLIPEKWMSTIIIVLAYVLSFLYLAYELGQAKAKRKKAKYYIALFKEN